jgi:hypothetical protein
VLFFGDSSMDYLKYTLPKGPCTGEKREGWTRLRQRLRPLRADNMAMSGAPAYELCCVSPLFLCVPCSRPRRAVVVSMGGNDFLWLPFPLVHEALGKCCNFDAPLQYMRCFLHQTHKFSPNLNVVFIPDTVIDENLYCSESYAKYCARLRHFAGVIVEPDASDEDVKKYLMSPTYYNHTSSEQVPMFKYRVLDRRSHKLSSKKYYKNFILVDPSRFLKRLKRTLDSKVYERLYDGVESSEKLLEMWEEWILYVLDLSPCPPPTPDEADSLVVVEMERLPKH